MMRQSGASFMHLFMRFHFTVVTVRSKLNKFPSIASNLAYRKYACMKRVYDTRANIKFRGAIPFASIERKISLVGHFRWLSLSTGHRRHKNTCDVAVLDDEEAAYRSVRAQRRVERSGYNM